MKTLLTPQETIRGKIKVLPFLSPRLPEADPSKENQGQSLKALDHLAKLAWSALHALFSALLLKIISTLFPRVSLMFCTSEPKKATLSKRAHIDTRIFIERGNPLERQNAIQYLWNNPYETKRILEEGRKQIKQFNL